MKSDFVFERKNHSAMQICTFSAPQRRKMVPDAEPVGHSVLGFVHAFLPLLLLLHAVLPEEVE